jgi:hypothetical protein
MHRHSLVISSVKKPSAHTDFWETSNNRWGNHKSVCADESVVSKTGKSLVYEIFEIVKQNCTTAFVGNPKTILWKRFYQAGKDVNIYEYNRAF